MPWLWANSIPPSVRSLGAWLLLTLAVLVLMIVMILLRWLWRTRQRLTHPPHMRGTVDGSTPDPWSEAARRLREDDEG